MNTDSNGEDRTPSFREVLGSVLAGMFGVQSSRNREKDFTHGKASHYIIIGLVMTLVFVLVVWGVVSLVMNLAGAG